MDLLCLLESTGHLWERDRKSDFTHPQKNHLVIEKRKIIVNSEKSSYFHFKILCLSKSILYENVSQVLFSRSTETLQKINYVFDLYIYALIHLLSLCLPRLSISVHSKVKLSIVYVPDAKRQHWGHGLKGGLCLQQMIVDSLLLSLSVPSRACQAGGKSPALLSHQIKLKQRGPL